MNPPTSASRRPLAVAAAFVVALAAALSLSPTLVPAAVAVPHVDLTLALDHTSLSTGDVVGGTVTTLDGQPIGEGEFEAALTAADESFTFQTVPVGTDGRFVLDVVPTAGTHAVAIRFSGASWTLTSTAVTFDGTPWTPEITVDVDDVLVGQGSIARFQVDLKGHPTIGSLEVEVNQAIYQLPLDGDLTLQIPQLDHAANYALDTTLARRGARQQATTYADFFVSKWYSSTTVTVPRSARVGDVVTLGAVNDRNRTDVTFTSTTPEVCTLAGNELTMVADGDCQGRASYPETDSDHSAGAYFTVPVSLVPTTVEVTATPAAVMKGAEVLVEATASIPGRTDVPAGSFTLTRGGDEVTLPAVDGRATFRVVAGTPGTIEHLVTFTPDDAALATSTASAFVDVDDPARYVPQITAKVTSTAPRTASGWYRAPVTVTFACASDVVALATACPAPVTLRHGRHAAITRTVTTTAGRSTTVTVPAINVDLLAPRVRLKGISAITSRAHLSAPKKPACVSSDATSGVATCSVRSTRSGDRITWTATAVDRAGHTSTATASVTLVKARIEGAEVVAGAAQAKAGRKHVLQVRSTVRPTLDGVKMTKDGKNTWRADVRFTTKQAGRTITLKPKAGRTTFAVKVKVVR